MSFTGLERSMVFLKLPLVNNLNFINDTNGKLSTLITELITEKKSLTANEIVNGTAVNGIIQY